MTYIEHLDDKLNFGKFARCTFAEVVEYNPEYISWVVENVSGAICVFADSLIEELRLLFPQFEISPAFEAMRNQRIAEYEYMEEGYNGNDDFYDHRFNDECELPTYERYAGSYAQNEMGYSDDDIDTIFDGDASAYWNID